MRLDWRYKLSLALVATSLAIYGVNYFIFRDWGYMMRLFFGQLGFLPLSIIVVTLVINQLLATRAQQARLHKMNIVIGAFFSEVGVALLKRCLGFDAHREELWQSMGAVSRGRPADFQEARQVLARHPYAVDLSLGDLAELKEFLVGKRDFLLRLLENPTLLEHEAFTNLLWAVCHLGEELGYRREVSRLAPPDREHLAGDLERAYRLLAAQWLSYLEYLKRAYPYLFSLAARINPLQLRAKAEIDLPDSET